MSNNTQSAEDLKNVGTEEVKEDAASTKDTEDPETPSPEQEAQKAHQKKVYEGEVKSHVTRVVMGEITLAEVPPYLQETVGTKIEAFIKPKEGNDVVDQAVEQIELNSIVRGLEKDQKSLADKDYKLFRKSGLTIEDAQTKLRKLYDLDAPEEAKRKATIKSQQTISMPSGYVATSGSDIPEVEPTNASEKKFVEKMRRK